MRVALVHDWLTGMRGGEKVLEGLCERFPDADIFTLFHHAGSVSPTIEISGIVQIPIGRYGTASGVDLRPAVMSLR